MHNVTVTISRDQVHDLFYNCFDCRNLLSMFTSRNTKHTVKRYIRLLDIYTFFFFFGNKKLSINIYK